MPQYSPRVPQRRTPVFESSQPVPLSRLALASMILGIISLPTLFLLGLGSLLGLAALILGFIALSRINNNPLQQGGKGFAIIGILTGGLGFAGTIVIASTYLVPALEKVMTMGMAGDTRNDPVTVNIRALGNMTSPQKRSLCFANLRGIMQAMNAYSAENNNHYPIIAPRGSPGAVTGLGGGSPDPDVNALIKSMYASSQPSVSQNVWLLVLTGHLMPKQFVCPSDPAPSAIATASNAGGPYFPNFNDGSYTANGLYAMSYGFAYPWRQDNGQIGDWWRSTRDAGLPLIADMGPMGTSDTGGSTPSNPKEMTATSFNHDRQGQNIAFGDAHAEFSRRPDVGHSSDNIYTGGGGTPDSAGLPYMGAGVPNIGNGGAAGDYDVCLVPVSDASDSFRRK